MATLINKRKKVGNKLRQVVARLVSYDNDGTVIKSSNMQDALDETITALKGCVQVEDFDQLNSELGAVKDLLNPQNVSLIPISTKGTLYESGFVIKYGHIVIATGIAKFSGLQTNTSYYWAKDLPIPKFSGVQISVPNEYGGDGTATFIVGGDGSIMGKCSHANNYYYFYLVYICV